MHLLQQFHPADPAIAQRFRGEHPLASTVFVGVGGTTVLNPIPMRRKANLHWANGLHFEDSVVLGRCIRANFQALIRWIKALSQMV